jgi:hypothetical protein
MIASLALCGAATAAVVISTAHAQPSTHEPVMVAQADNPGAGNRGLGRRGNRPAPADLSQRLDRLCQDMVARQTGDLAYLETRLNLTSSQQPLFQRWKDAKLAIAHRHADQCAQRVDQRVAQRQNSQAANQAAQIQPAINRPDPAQRMAQEEDRLKQRVADIDAERPSLAALYNVLSPDQKTALDRTGMRGRGGMMGGRRFALAGPPMGGRGMGPPGMGSTGRPPMPPDGPDAPPPPR